jgi:hypothetical protein
MGSTKPKPGLALKARVRLDGWALSQAEECKDRENNDDQTDDVDDVVHDTKPPVALY